MALKPKTTAGKGTRVSMLYRKGNYFIGKGRYKKFAFIVGETYSPKKIGIIGTLIDYSKSPAKESKALFSRDMFAEYFTYHEPGS